MIIRTTSTKMKGINFKMAIENKKTYLVLNYCTNYVSVATRYDSFVLDPCRDGNPSSVPLSIEEIQQINNTSDVFKLRTLCFEPEYEESIYEVLRIRDWREKLTNEQAEEILKRNNKDDMELIISIKEPRYFDRIYGIYVGLKNAGYPFNRNVEYIMSTRYKELSENKINSKISLGKAEESDSADVRELQKQNEDMAEQMRQMQEIMAQMMAQIGKSGSEKQNVSTDDATEEKPKKATKAKAKTE